MMANVHIDNDKARTIANSAQKKALQQAPGSR